jgi:hypothetical protein
MNFPFYYTTFVATSISREQVIENLYKYTITDNGKTFKDKRATVINKYQYEKTGKNIIFKAKIKKTDFKLARILYSETGRHGNSFNPFCFGKLEMENGSCVIKLQFRPAIVIIFFMLIWLGALLFGTVEIMINELQNGGMAGALITPIVLSPFYLLVWGFNKFAFKREVNRTLEFLNHIVMEPAVATIRIS